MMKKSQWSPQEPVMGKCPGCGEWFPLSEFEGCEEGAVIIGLNQK